MAASTVAGALYTYAAPTVAFLYLAAWVLVALTVLGWALAGGQRDRALR